MAVGLGQDGGGVILEASTYKCAHTCIQNYLVLCK